MTNLSETQTGVDWLSRFDETDRPAATGLIDELLLVSRNDFANGLGELLGNFTSGLKKSNSKIALYAERPIRTVFGRSPSFFPNSRHGRAKGPGVQPVVVNPLDQEVGSEGLVAQLITDFCRSNPSIAINHPGPTKLRRDRVRYIVLVTDFIGSGKRIHKMLESFRYVATIRSWRSYGLIRFVVAAYSGSEFGVRKVRSHRLKPNVLLRVGCPTIYSAFSGAQRDSVEALCEMYPKGHKEPFGFRNTGALIAFAHGCPNNVPPILHSGKGGWRPLFAKRSTASTSVAFSDESSAEVLDQRVQNLLGIREARLSLISYDGGRWISSMLVLVAAEAGIRSRELISARTHLTIAEVSHIIDSANAARWITDAGKLTPLGRKELARLRRRRKRSPILSSGPNNFYYPTQLRAP